MFIIFIILFLSLLYLFTLKGRVGFTDFNTFKGFKYAHRGLYSDTVPENSILAFKKAVENGFGAELDVHLTADGQLVVIHDYSLERTTGVEGTVEDLTLLEIKKYNLENTNERVPTLEEVLEIFEDKTPIIIELKATNKNYIKLSSAVAFCLKNYKGNYCIESFDPRCVRWFKKNSPQTIRGQLAENFLVSKNSKIPFVYKFAITFLLTNFLTKPDFVAYKFEEKNNLSFKICRRFHKMQGVTWTIKDRISLRLAECENLIPIFEKIRAD
ncbi:MAG: glycerophosphodiester phosphodiesterase [Clostridia bacterium]|nr:glycerophosphodiester phosphodiesterase [Clostridia bacterium]